LHGAHHDLVALLVLVAGSLLMPLLSGRLRLPSAALLIGYGVAVGPHALGWIHDAQVVGFLSELGFIILMFLAGLEIDFNAVRQRGKRALALMLSVCIAVFGLAFSLSHALGLHPMMGLALAAMSVGLPLAVLKETGKLRSPLGQVVMLVGSLGELVTVIGMTGLYFFFQHGVSLQLLMACGKLLGMLILLGLSLRILMALAWWFPDRFSRAVAEHDASEIGVRSAMVLMVAFSLLAALAGLEAIVGAFVAGALIAFVLRGKEVLEEKLSVVGHGFLIPIFFVVVGVRFETHAVSGPTLLLAGELLLATFVTRLLPSALLLSQGLRPRQILSIASLLSAPLTLVVAIATLGHELGVIDKQGRATLIVLAVLCGVLFPVLFRLLETCRRDTTAHQGSKRV